MAVYDIKITAPERLCKWCQAEIVFHPRTGTYSVTSESGCLRCAGTGDHNFIRNGRQLTLAEYTVGTVRK